MYTLEQGRSHIIRNCIFCGHDDSQILFTYTYDFLLNVRNMKEEMLSALGWDQKTTSSIVECQRCGCNYIRDIFIIYETNAEKLLSEREKGELVETYSKPFSFENMNYLRYCRALADTLLRHFAKQSADRHSISLLDFGSSLSSFSVTARASGFNPVVLYDPYFRPNIAEAVSKRHPLDFHFVKDKDDLQKFAPFDVIVCQAAVEHFHDPQPELRFMRELLGDDGILFITNPCAPLNEKGKLLSKENRIQNVSLRRKLRKDYHLQHVNFFSPKQFSHVLKSAGFKEKSVFLYYPFLNTRAFGMKNIIRIAKACVLYALDALRVRHKKKTAYFAVKD